MPEQSEVAEAVAAHRSAPRGSDPGALRFGDTSVLVTGGAKNIGLEISAALLDLGARVAIVDKDANALKEVRAELAARHGDDRVSICHADIASREQRSEAFSKLAAGNLAPFGGVVNNAYATGATADLDPLEVPLEIHELAFETNVLAAYDAVRMLLGDARRTNTAASVVNVLSGASLRPVPRRPAYSVSKAAMAMLTRQLAIDLSPTIRVNAVVPGMVAEGGIARSPAIHAAVASGGIPLGRIGTPDEVAAAACFLLSPAASYITGALLECTGGR